ncbi:MAG: biotin--[acetyl-CoA-carboxylase] ligase [Bacteroidales bacterium]|nr:biotin--[acetyl-CoA-carboxylase] ligase [Bacteroidales bacterium]
MKTLINLNNLIHLESIDSTNNYANKLVKEKEIQEGTIIWANHQISGRGHGSNYWESEPGKNLTFSIIYHPDFLHIDDHFYISRFISLGLTDFLEKEIENVSIKWPNDIFVENKKIAGILIENTIIKDKITTSIIGIGLNVNQNKFTSDAPNPVSLSQIMNKEYDLNKLLESVIHYIDKRYLELKSNEKKGIFLDYLEKLYKLNCYSQFKLKEKYFEGKIIGTTAKGKLIIEKADGEIQTFDFKEIEYC